jgi:Recombinase
LAAAKARGVTLGNPKIDEARQKAAAEIVDHADQRAANVIPIMRQIQRSGATSLRQIAEALNARGINAPRGGQWHATSIRNVMARAWLEAIRNAIADDACRAAFGRCVALCLLGERESSEISSAGPLEA